MIAMGTALALVYGDETAGERARTLLPAVRLAATLADPRDFWAAATRAECALYEALLGMPGPGVEAAYREAAALRPTPGDRRSTHFQLEFLGMLGLPAEALAAAARGLG